ncbi:uncharacterized protein LOC144241690 isoform X2 [Crocuta crocuta]
MSWCTLLGPSTQKVENPRPEGSQENKSNWWPGCGQGPIYCASCGVSCSLHSISPGQDRKLHCGLCLRRLHIDYSENKQHVGKDISHGEGSCLSLAAVDLIVPPKRYAGPWICDLFGNKDFTGRIKLR